MCDQNEVTIAQRPKEATITTKILVPYFLNSLNPINKKYR